MATLLEEARRQLRGFCAACRLGPEEEALAFEMLTVLSSSWGSRELSATPRWSGLTDDCSPLEFSIAFTPSGALLRLCVEAHGDSPSPETYWDAAMDLNRRLGVKLDRFEQVADLFRPRAAHGERVYFAALHAAELRGNRPPKLKTYLNPAASLGQFRAKAVIHEALKRLDPSSDWVLRLAHPGDEFLILSLDLGEEPGVNVYLRHRGCAIAELEKFEDQAGWFADRLFGQREFPRPVFTALKLPLGCLTPLQVCLQVPTYPMLSEDELRPRIHRILEELGLDTAAYEATRGLGLQNYVSFQWENGQPRVTVYYSARFYHDRHGPIGMDPVRVWPSPVV